MEKTLKTIQTLSKVGEILCRIMFILCIVGFVCCAVGLASFAVGVAMISISGKSLEIYLHEVGVSAGTVYAALVVAMILCAGEAVIARFAVHYFRREQRDGTHFDLGGAKELLRLGILQIGVTLGAEILAAIAHRIISVVCEDVQELSFSNSTSVLMGLVIMMVALICRYGAEKCNNETPPSDQV